MCCRRIRHGAKIWTSIPSSYFFNFYFNFTIFALHYDLFKPEQRGRYPSEYFSTLQDIHLLTFDMEFYSLQPNLR